MWKSLLKRIAFRNAAKYRLENQTDSIVKSIAFVQFAGLGDAALLAPHIASLISEYSVTVFCSSQTAGFWKLFLPSIQIEIIDISLGIGKKLADNVKKSNHEFDAVFCTSINSTAAFVSAYIKSAIHFGMIDNSKAFYGAELIFDKIYNAATNEHIHKRYNSLINLGKIKTQVLSDYSIPFSSEKDDTVLIHPGAKWKPRAWDAERFATIAQKLVQSGKNVKIILGPNEKDLHSIFESKISIDNIIAPDGIKELVENIASAALFVCNDSGPAHIAALCGTKTLILWGPGNFERVAPLGKNINILFKEVPCRPCRQYIHKDKCQNGINICLQNISIEEVEIKINELLELK